jgi:hypothetical protein
MIVEFKTGRSHEQIDPAPAVEGASLPSDGDS